MSRSLGALAFRGSAIFRVRHVIVLRSFYLGVFLKQAMLILLILI